MSAISFVMVYCFCNDDLLNHKSNATSVAIQTMPTSCYAWQYMIYGNELIHVAIRSMATNKIAWQMVLLPRHDDRGNNIRSLATNKIAWQMIILPRHNGRGNNI